MYGKYKLFEIYAEAKEKVYEFYGYLYNRRLLVYISTCLIDLDEEVVTNFIPIVDKFNFKVVLEF